jgi:hypothetical protein
MTPAYRLTYKVRQRDMSYLPVTLNLTYNRLPL